MRGSRWFTTLAAVGVAVGIGVSAQSAHYVRILELYRQGQVDAAVMALAALPVEERYRGARRVVRESLHPFRRDVLQAVLALHTEVSLGEPLTLCDSPAAARRANPDGGEHPLLRSGFPLFEYGLLETLKAQFPDDEFLSAWYVTTMAYYDRGFPGGIRCYENAPPRIQAHAEMQLALGAMHEKTWQQTESYGWGLPVLEPSLQTAEQAFRAALRAAPGLHEARLRLGHVLLLQERPEQALETFRQVGEHLDGGFAYLVRLFEGQACEQLGDPERDAAAYRAARAMQPHAQSATMALAQLAYSQGHRTEALEHIRQLYRAAAAGPSLEPWVWYAEGADPWSWYYHGTAWRYPAYLARLRSLVVEQR